MRIFISYAESESDSAEKLAATLQNHGHVVMYSEHSWPEGSTRRFRYGRAIKESDLFVFLLSPDSIKEGCENLSHLAIARSQWRSPKNRVLPVLAAPVDESNIPAFLKSVEIYQPDGELVSEISNAVYFAQKGQKTRKLFIGGVAGIITTFFVMLAMYYGISLSTSDSTIVIGQEEFLPDFSFYPAELHLYSGHKVGDIKLLNPNPMKGASYRCKVDIPKNHRNIEQINFDDECDNIHIVLREAVFTDVNGVPYNKFKSYDEGILLKVENKDGEVIWKSNLPLFLTNSYSNLDLVGLKPYRNKNQIHKKSIAKPDEYEIALMQDMVVTIATGDVALSDEYDCEYKAIERQSGFNVRLLKKIGACSFLLRGELLRKGIATDRIGNYMPNTNFSMRFGVRHVKSDWSMDYICKVYILGSDKSRATNSTDGSPELNNKKSNFTRNVDLVKEDLNVDFKIFWGWLSPKIRFRGVRGMPAGSRWVYSTNGGAAYVVGNGVGDFSFSNSFLVNVMSGNSVIGRFDFTQDLHNLLRDSFAQTDKSKWITCTTEFCMVNGYLCGAPWDSITIDSDRDHVGRKDIFMRKCKSDKPYVTGICSRLPADIVDLKPESKLYAALHADGTEPYVFEVEMDPDAATRRCH